MREPRAKVLQQAKARHKKAIENYRLAKKNKKGVAKARTEARLSKINELKATKGDLCKFNRLYYLMTLSDASKLLHKKTGKQIHSQLICRMEDGEKVPNHVSYAELLSIYDEVVEITTERLKFVIDVYKDIIDFPELYTKGRVGGFVHKAKRDLEYLMELWSEL